MASGADGTSIEHIAETKREAPPLADFRSLGVIARAFLAANLLAVAAATALAAEPAQIPGKVLGVVALVDPPLILSLAALYLLAPSFRRWTWRRLAGLAAGVAAGATTLLYYAVGPDQRDLLLPQGLAMAVAWSMMLAAAVLYYLYLRARAFSPAIAEARLQALTARIRPHFLFNSLNAVLGILRQDPRTAEQALEVLAELFRALMADNRGLVPLADELQLARRYLELEALRLGTRLAVEWQVESSPLDARVPPLLLQPLLENAVYHGIEPTVGGGKIRVDIVQRGEEILIEIRNPYSENARRAAGNRMALANIRERLSLFFDLQARLTTAVEGAEHVLAMRFPYRR